LAINNLQDLKMVRDAYPTWLMLDRGQNTHEQGADVWEEERQRSIVERSADDAKKAPKFDL
jgi:hypothetical protein